jgi:hypothetical protein
MVQRRQLWPRPARQASEKTGEAPPETRAESSPQQPRRLDGTTGSPTGKPRALPGRWPVESAEFFASGRPGSLGTPREFPPLYDGQCPRQNRHVTTPGPKRKHLQAPGRFPPSRRLLVSYKAAPALRLAGSPGPLEDHQRGTGWAAAAGRGSKTQGFNQQCPQASHEALTLPFRNQPPTSRTVFPPTHHVRLRTDPAADRQG